MYADDHHVYQTGSNVKAIISEKEAENVSHWYIGTLVHWYIGTIFYMPIQKKYQVLALTPRNNDREAKDGCTLDIDNQKLKPTANIRSLGVNIDDQLGFFEHISEKKECGKLGVLARPSFNCT